MRRSAVSEARQVETSAQKWRSFAADPKANLARMEQTVHSIQAIDLAAVSTAVQKAEKDWPAKKSDLESRMKLLNDHQEKAKTDWEGAKTAREQAANGALGGPQLATLIATDDALANDKDAVATGAKQLTDLSGQLYNSWDKILADLEISQFGRDHIYRERIKTVRNHLTDPAAKKGEVTNEDHGLTFRNRRTALSRMTSA